MEIGNRDTLKNELRVTCDWLSFTIFNKTVDEVCAFLGFNEEDFTEMPKGGMGYKSMRRVNGYSISILYDGNEDMGVHVSCSGSSISELIRSFVETKKIETPFGDGFEFDNGLVCFIQEISLLGKFTRFDIALDDIGAQYYTLDYLDQLANKKIGDKRLVTKFRKFFRNNPKTVGSLDKVGDSLDFGSRKSDTYMRIYDKRLEQKQKTKEDLGVDWIRWEIEFKGERAQQIALAVAEREELGSVFVAVLNNYFCIKNVDDSNITRCSVDSLWQKFVSTTEKLRLFVSRAEKTLEEKENWFKMQVAPTLAGIIVAREGRTNIIYDFFEHYLDRMSRDMQNICDRYVPNWREDWGVNYDYDPEYFAC